MQHKYLDGRRAWRPRPSPPELICVEVNHENADPNRRRCRRSGHGKPSQCGRCIPSRAKHQPRCRPRSPRNLGETSRPQAPRASWPSRLSQILSASTWLQAPRIRLPTHLPSTCRCPLSVPFPLCPAAPILPPIPSQWIQREYRSSWILDCLLTEDPPRQPNSVSLRLPRVLTKKRHLPGPEREEARGSPSSEELCRHSGLAWQHPVADAMLTPLNEAANGQSGCCWTFLPTQFLLCPAV